MNKGKVHRSGPLVRFVGGLAALGVIFASLWLFVLWYRATESGGVPAVVTPRPWVYHETQQVDALLLWNEKVLRSPKGGTLQLRAGGASQAVAKGESVASLVSLQGRMGLRSPDKGVFLPWVDGEEGKWLYSRFWPGTDAFPDEPKKYELTDGAELQGDLVIGKLIPTPQRPRALLYLDLTPSLKKDLEAGRVELKFDLKGRSWTADVRVWMEVGAGKAKAALDLPLFPLWMMEHRKVSVWLLSGSENGVLVPESSVVMRDGTWGVFELLGNQLVWRPVEGVPTGAGQFFVRKGLDLANPVVIDGHSARERRVDLW